MTDMKYDENDETNYRKRDMKNDIKEKLSFDDSMVCRDFLRNVCKRDHCKYFHPKRDDNKEMYMFCHDYQNGGCIRVGCRFVHCSVEEEDYYHKHGELLPHINELYKKTMENFEEDNYSICIDYIKGKCKRDNCKFRHITSKDLPPDRRNRTIVKCSRIEERYKRQRNEHTRCCDEYHVCKRRRHRSDSPDLEMRSYDMNDNRTMWILESENEMLRKRVMELKKKNEDLQATNEFLLEQNARLRIGDKTTPSLAAVTVPAVTITNTGSLQHQGQVNMPQPQVMNALRTVAASMATVPVSLAATMATVPVSLAASMATVPVSLAAVATTPVSLTAVSMAPVQIPPIVTVAQAPNDPTLTANLSTESQSLVSYPILSGSTIIQGTMQHH